MIPGSTDPDWNSFATLSNDLSEALKGHGLLFSERRRIAEAMWHKGYRPTTEAIERVVVSQREELARERGKEWRDVDE